MNNVDLDLMNDNPSIYLTIVIPAYNEESRLPKTLDSIFAYMANKDYLYEIIVVDDGSQDNTSEIVKAYSEYPHNLKLIRQDTNHGKGYAVRKGIEKAKGEYVIFNDADGASPIEEIEKLQKAISNGADIAIGSRALKESNVSDSLFRKILGIGFNKLIKIIILKGFQDTQCGFKLFKTDCAKCIFDKLILIGFSFDVEVLFIAKKIGYKIEEVPISWQAIPGTKLNPIIDAPIMLLAIIKIRIMDLFGKYKT